MNPMDLITFIQRAMGMGADAGGALVNAMSGSPQPQGAGAGRGSVNPPMVNPAAARPRGILAQPTAPVAAPALPAPIEVATAAVDRLPPDTSADNIDAGGGWNPGSVPVSDAVPVPVPQQPQQPGFFSRLMDDSKTGVSPIEHLLRGFTAAGTQNPSQTMMQFASQDTENEKIRQAKRRAMQGETKHLGNGVFAEYGPDGRFVRTFIDSTAAGAEKDAQTSKILGEIELAKAKEAAKSGSKGPKTLTGALQKAEDADYEVAFNARQNAQQIAPLINDLGGPDGTKPVALDINPINVVKWKAQTLAGFSSPEALKYEQLETTVKRAVNEGLRLNKGVQTEGDAQREADSVMAAWAKGDLGTVRQGLMRLNAINESRAKFAEEQIARRRESQGVGTSSGAAAAPQASPAPAARAQNNPAVEAALKSAGKTYDPQNFEYRMQPDGSVLARRK